MTKFNTAPYPIQVNSAAPGTSPVQFDIRKFLTDDNAMLSRMFLRIKGPLVKTSSAAGTATGNDNPTGLVVSTNLSTSPIYGNCVPLNAVSSRGVRIDGMFNEGWNESQTALTDAAGTVQLDLWFEYDFRRSDGAVIEGIDYAMPLGKYKSMTLSTVFGGRDQLFTGGTSSWDTSGLTLEWYADLDVASNPAYVHAVELFEQVISIPNSNASLIIDTLPAGFIYTDLYLLTEEANALADGILNNISITSGAQTWLLKGETNAAAVREMFSKRNNRTITDAGQTFTGIYAIPLRDGMFTKGYDQRFSAPLLTVDVTAGAATQLRLVGRRIIPGGLYIRADSK